MAFDIVKADTAQHIAYGWGNISVDQGELVTDRQGDQIDPATLEDAVVDFMLNSRDSGVMHEGEAVAKVIASFVTTPDIIKAFFGDALGDNIDKVPIGWMLGVKVLDAQTWQDVVDGKLRAFSIQGTADRIDEAA